MLLYTVIPGGGSIKGSGSEIQYIGEEVRGLEKDGSDNNNKSNK